MKRPVVIIALIVIIVIGFAITLDLNTIRVVDWTESYNEKSNKPFGISVLYKELPTLFKSSKMRTVYHRPANYLYANAEDSYGDHVAKGSYLIIGNSGYLGDEDCVELLHFVGQGNTLFISDYYFPNKLMDTLGLAIDVMKNKDSLAQLRFNYSGLKENHVEIDRCLTSRFFSAYDSDAHNVIGYVNTNSENVNFLEIPFEDGQIYLHLEPKVFANYNMLKGNRWKYVEGALSYLPKDDLYFDSYTKYFDYYGDTEKKSDLNWFLNQTSFRWAWYLALALTLLFIIFNAKRRQRIIKTLRPLDNTTVGFVKTVSNLYFETQDHKNLIDKKIVYFLEKIRTDHHLDTSQLNESFIDALAAKSGKKKNAVKKLVNYIKWLRTKNEFFEDNLLKLNKHIEDFYTK